MGKSIKYDSTDTILSIRAQSYYNTKSWFCCYCYFCYHFTYQTFWIFSAKTDWWVFFNSSQTIWLVQYIQYVHCYTTSRNHIFLFLFLFIFPPSCTFQSHIIHCWDHNQGQSGKSTHHHLIDTIFWYVHMHTTIHTYVFYNCWYFNHLVTNYLLLVIIFVVPSIFFQHDQEECGMCSFLFCL